MRTKLFAALLLAASLTACKKDGDGKSGDGAVLCPDNPRKDVPTELRGTWMYGHFSMTEYWSQNPGEYLGPAVQYAFAFRFYANGSYEQYFTSSTVSGGVTTYQQSVSKGTVVVNEATKTFTTYCCTAHYKRTRAGQTVEERDLLKSELGAPTQYAFTTGTEPSGTKALYLTLQGTSSPLTFLQK